MLLQIAGFEVFLFLAFDDQSIRVCTVWLLLCNLLAFTNSIDICVFGCWKLVNYCFTSFDRGVVRL